MNGATIIHRLVEEARAGTLKRTVTRVSSGWVVMGEAQFLEGYCLLLPDPVVGSLNELDSPGRSQFLLDMARIGDAVTRVCRPRRINYEILGNLEPALHAHIFPRFESEPPALRTKAVWAYPEDTWKDTSRAFDPEKHRQLRSAIRRELESIAPPAKDPLWQEAVSFACRVHQGHFRKDHKTPYAAHPLRVALTVRDLFACDDQACVTAAILHDTIEDSPVDYDEILEFFGREVADTVAALSKDMRQREEVREPAYDAQLRAAGWRAAVIKLADVYDNLCDLRSRKDQPKLSKQIERCNRALEVARLKVDQNPCVSRAMFVVQNAMSRAEASTQSA